MEKFHSCLLNYCKNINGSAWKNLIPALQKISFVWWYLISIFLETLQPELDMCYTIYDVSYHVNVYMYLVLVGLHLTRPTWLTIYRVYPQNGVCIQKYNFWPKNDGEKWSRFLHAGDHFIKVPKITNSVTKITIFQHGGISKYFFLDHFSPSFLGQTLKTFQVFG